MAVRQVLHWPIDIVFRPSTFVRIDPNRETDNMLEAATETVRITGFYFLNLLLYALPLTLAGFGIQSGTAVPVPVATLLEPIVADPGVAWQFSVSVFLNGTFLLIATVLTLVTFHVGVVLTGSSNGVLRSLRAVSYSTGVYLAVMFSTVVFVSTESGFAVAESLLLWIQATFVQFVIDFVGADLVAPVEATRPELAEISTVEQAVLTVLLLSAVYFLYVLYLGARTSHGATRLEATFATAFVLVSPALYILGAIALTVGLP